MYLIYLSQKEEKQIKINPTLLSSPAFKTTHILFFSFIFCLCRGGMGRWAVGRAGEARGGSGGRLGGRCRAEKSGVSKLKRICSKVRVFFYFSFFYLIIFIKKSGIYKQGKRQFHALTPPTPRPSPSWELLLPQFPPPSGQNNFQKKTSGTFARSK